eukprot:360433-Chlamydomonas_euryale.AAC.7
MPATSCGVPCNLVRRCTADVSRPTGPDPPRSVPPRASAPCPQRDCTTGCKPSARRVGTAASARMAEARCMGGLGSP